MASPKLGASFSPRLAVTPNSSYSDLSAFDEFSHAHACAERSDVPVKIFDSDGRTTFKDIGVNTLHFQQLTWFFTIISLPWWKLFLVTTSIYIFVLLVLACVYHIVSTLCGAHDVSFFVALYFDAVTISANGGYMGEDKLMTTVGTTCFRHRTILIVVGSYLNIVIGAIFAALFVSKAALSSRLQHRIVFSLHCALTPLSQERYNLTFRMASVSKKAFVHGKLRLYMVSSVPWSQTSAPAPAKRKASAKDLKSNSVDGAGGRAAVNIAPQPHSGASNASDAPDDDGSADEFLTVRTSELGWRCEEEFMLDEDDNDLMLWFPCTIVHRIDASSPLHTFMTTQRRRGGSGGSAAASLGKNFQIVAVFEAVDAETSAVIERKHMYTAYDIIHNYNFAHASVIVRDHEDAQNVTVDFYRFNEMTPCDP